MSVRPQLAFWLAVLVALGFLFWLLRGVLLPFVLGAILAYLLAPAAARLQGLGLSRAWATGVPVVLLLGLLIGAVALLVPVVLEQLFLFLHRLPETMAAAAEALRPLADRALGVIGTSHPEGLRETIAAHAEGWAAPAVRWLGRVLVEGLSVLTVLSLLAITPLVTFYMLYNWPGILRAVDGWLPREHAGVLRQLIGEIDRVLFGFFHGTAVLCLTLGAIYAVALSLVGLEYGLVIGLSAGLLSFVPYLGTAYGLIASVGVAIFQFWPAWIWIATVLSIFIAGQLVADYVLTPRLIGGRVGLHPLWVLFGVLAGGALFGFLGVLLAVPVTASIGVLARFLLGRYLESSLYRGPGAS